jgi:hypothetical protein
MGSSESRFSPERRHWLGRAGIYASACLLPAASARSLPQNPPPRPNASDPGPKEEDGPRPALPTTKVILEANDKDIKKSVEKLFQLATELKNEVEKTDSVTILSLAMVRKAEEIERLAKEIKSRAKG